MEYKEYEEKLSIPKGSGVEGFIRALRSVLTLPRLKQVVIDGRGSVSYTYSVRENEGKRPITEESLHFDDLMPYALVRNGVVTEMMAPEFHHNAANALGHLFQAVAADHLFPVAFVAGANSRFWQWYTKTTALSGPHEELFGVPFLTDRMLPDEVLVLCAAYNRGDSIMGTQKSYKIVIPTEVPSK